MPVPKCAFSSSGPAITRGRTRIVLGVEVDTLDVTLYPRSDSMLNGLTIAAACAQGAMDGATMKLERAFLATDLSVIGSTILFFGRFADLSVSRTEIGVRVNSFLEALNTQLPRNVYGGGCVHTLYDARCTVARSAFAVAGSVQAGATAQRISCALANVSGWFNAGYILMTSGQLTGTRRTIKSYLPGAITLLSALPTAPATGDTFNVYPGCNRGTDCAAKFGNLPNFRATPYIPVPETAI